MRTLSITTSIIIALSISSIAHAGSKWTKHGTKNGVTVYTQPVEGSDVPRVKAVTTVSGDAEEVWNSLGSMTKKGGFKVFKKLGPCGENCEYIYQRLGHALMKDRHYVIKMRWSESEEDGLKTFKRSWRKTDERDVIGTGAIPVEKISGSWTFKAVDGGERTRIVYLNHMDLGGNVPDGIFTNGFIKHGYKILAKFRMAFN